MLIFDKILQKGFEGQHFITGLSNHFRDLAVSIDPQTLQLLDSSEDVKKMYQEQSKRCEALFIYQALKICNDCDVAYRQSKNKRLLIELTLIRLSQLKDSKKKYSN